MGARCWELQLSLAQLGWLGLAQLCSIQQRVAQLSSIQLSTTQLSKTQFHSSAPGSAQHDSLQLGSAQKISAQFSSVQRGSTQLRSVQLSSAWLGKALHRLARHGTARHGLATHGMARFGIIWLNMARHGTPDPAARPLAPNRDWRGAVPGRSHPAVPAPQSRGLRRAPAGPGWQRDRRTAAGRRDSGTLRSGTELRGAFVPIPAGASGGYFPFSPSLRRGKARSCQWS